MAKLKFKMYNMWGGKAYSLTGEQMIKELRGYANQIEEAIKDEDGLGIKASLMCGKGFALHCVETEDMVSRWSEKEFFEGLQFKG